MKQNNQEVFEFLKAQGYPAPAIRQALRVLMGFQHDDIGRVLGVTGMCVQHYLAGRRRKDRYRQARIAALFGVKLDDFFPESKHESPPAAS